MMSVSQSTLGPRWVIRQLEELEVATVACQEQTMRLYSSSR